MNADAGPRDPSPAYWNAGQSRWAAGWRLFATRAVALAYLLYVVGGIRQDARGATAVLGYAALAAFAVTWLVIPLPAVAAPRRFWPLYAVLVALLVLELPLAHATAFVLAVFLTITIVARLDRKSVV